MEETSYGFGRRLTGTSFEQAVEKVTAALKQEGFGVLSEIDIQDALKKKLDLDFRRYLVLGACNPSLAHQALTVEPQIGLLLPCNVVIQDAPDQAISVSIADPNAMFRMVDNPALAHIAEEANARLRRVADSLGAV